MSPLRISLKLHWHCKLHCFVNIQKFLSGVNMFWSPNIINSRFETQTAAKKIKYKSLLYSVKSHVYAQKLIKNKLKLDDRAAHNPYRIFSSEQLISCKLFWKCVINYAPVHPNLEITRYFKIAYTVPATGKCHYAAFLCTNISRSHLLYKIMHFIIIVRTTGVIHSSPCAICFPDCCSCRPVCRPVPSRRWAHKHVAWMVSFIHPFRFFVFLSFRVLLLSIHSSTSLVSLNNAPISLRFLHSLF